MTEPCREPIVRPDAYASLNGVDAESTGSLLEESSYSSEEASLIGDEAPARPGLKAAHHPPRDPREPLESATTRDFSEQPFFQYGVGGVILLNTVVISLEAAYVQHQELKHIFASAELVFTVIYVAEITMRIRALGARSFFLGEDWGWNWFDFAITATGVMDVVMSAVGFAGVGASAARLFRVLRILRLFRAFRFLSEIDYVIHTAARAMLKLAMLVVLVNFVSAIVVTNILWDVPDGEVADMYSNLGNSMWTMFKLMTLENWIGTVEDTTKAMPDMLPFFVCFIFVGSIAMMSLVPAIFIELNLSDRDKAEQRRVQQEREEAYRSKAQKIRHFFTLVDRDGSGKVSISEMASFLKRAPTVDEIKSTGAATDDEMRDMKLGLFDLWESKIEEKNHLDIELTEEEFLAGVLQTWGVVDEKTLWRSVTASRMQLREVTGLVKQQQVQLERQQRQLDLMLQLHGHQKNQGASLGGDGAADASQSAPAFL